MTRKNGGEVEELDFILMISRKLLWKTFLRRHVDQRKQWGCGVGEAVALTLNQSNDSLCPSTVADITSPAQAWRHSRKHLLALGEPGPQRTPETLSTMP